MEQIPPLNINTASMGELTNWINASWIPYGAGAEEPCNQDHAEDMEVEYNNADMNEDEDMDVDGNAAKMNDKPTVADSSNKPGGANEEGRLVVSRLTWNNQKVNLLHQCSRGIVCEGVIILFDPNMHCFKGRALGDEFVGVCISSIQLHNVSTEQTDKHCYACNNNISDSDLPTLVLWPVEFVEVIGKGLLQRRERVGDNNVVVEENDIPSIPPLDVFMPEKRPYTFLKRKRRHEKVQKVREANNCSEETMQDIRGGDCGCQNNCLGRFTVSQLVEARSIYKEKNHDDKKTYIYNLLSHAYAPSLDVRNKGYPIDGEWICSSTVKAILGISKSTWWRYQMKHTRGAQIGWHGNRGKVRTTSRVLAAQSVFEKFVQYHGGSMPHKSAVDEEGCRKIVRMLPAYFTQKVILKMINNLLEEMKVEKISQSAFSKFWTKNFSDVKRMQYNNFSKCNICVDLVDRLEKSKREVERSVVRKEMRIHTMEQMSCRSTYWMWRTLSSMEPENFLCIIHDKMDQQKTCLPQLRSVPKCVARSLQLQISLAGFITHGQGAVHHGHFTLELWGDGPNFHVGSIAKALRDVERGFNGDVHSTPPLQYIFKALHDTAPMKLEDLTIGRMDKAATPIQVNPIQGRRLPKKLLLQLDNCAGQNKNKYLFAYLSYLTWVGVFEMIYVGYLMPGHTHEDIDAMFGHYRIKLQKSDVTTYPRLLELFKQCSSPPPIGSLIQEVPDWKAFIESYAREDLVGHSAPLQFRFWVKDGKPIMQYKMRAGDPVWKPEDKDILVWKEDVRGEPMVPTREPKALKPLAEVKDCERTKEGIMDYIKH